MTTLTPGAAEQARSRALDEVARAAAVSARVSSRWSMPCTSSQAVFAQQQLVRAVHQGERPSLEDCLCGGPRDGALGVLGAVDADDDAAGREQDFVMPPASS